MVLKTYKKSINKGLIIEKDSVISLFDTLIPKNLMFLFFAQENIKKLSILKQASDRVIKNVGVVGAGLMGGGLVGGLLIMIKPCGLKIFLGI